MIRKVFLSVVALMMGTFICNAAGIDGKWKASFEGPNGKMEILFSFKAEGKILTGSVTSPMGELAITNGKIEGNEFSFDMDMNGTAIPHKGKVDGDTITMKVTAENFPGNGEMVLKRVVE